MRSLCKSALLIGGLLLGSLAFAQKTQLLVYTALEVDQLKAYQEGFNKVLKKPTPKPMRSWVWRPPAWR